MDTRFPEFEELARQFIKEQRRKRRWTLFFRFFYLALVLFVIFLLIPGQSDDGYKKSKPHVAVIDVEGPIFSDELANADKINESLDDAFDNKNTVAVVLNINSPGGTPVQASDIYNHIRYLRSQHKDVKVYAVCSDVCASGAYFVASAADEIYANPASLVGSIGVIMEGFGFVDTMQKLGITRRVVISGDNKDFMDPFQPLKDTDVAEAQELLDTVHQQFIAAVEKGRGDRLKVTTPNLFSGQVWTGSQALPLGLIDGFGSVDSVARDVIKNDVIVNYTIKPSLFDTFTMTMGKTIGAEFTAALGLDSKTPPLEAMAN